MSEQFWSGVPLAGIALVLLLFGVSEWVRANRNGGRGWPLSWGVLSAMFLLSLSFVAGSGAFRVFSERTPEFYELWAVRIALWVSFGVSVWALWRWWHPREDQ